MNPARVLLYFFGILLVIVSIVVFFFATNLDRWVPVTLLGAGILLILGLSVMGFADSAPEGHHHHGGHGGDHGHGEGGDLIIKK